MGAGPPGAAGAKDTAKGRPTGPPGTAGAPGTASWSLPHGGKARGGVPRLSSRCPPSLLFDLKKVTMAVPQAARQAVCCPAGPGCGTACVRMIFSGGNPCELCSV